MPVDRVRPRTCRPRGPATAPAPPPPPGRRAAFSFSTSPTPVIVPPVPTPATNASSAPVRLLEDLEGRRAAVDLGVRGVLELLRHEVVGMLAHQLRRREHGARHALDGRREMDLGAEAREQALALHAHVVGHREDQPVALHRGRHGEPDAGVAAGRLDDRAARLAARRGARRPRSSRAPIRSLTLPPGLSDSTFATTTAPPAFGRRLSRTIGVPPTRSSTDAAIPRHRHGSASLSHRVRAPADRRCLGAAPPCQMWYIGRAAARPLRGLRRQLAERELVDHPRDRVGDLAATAPRGRRPCPFRGRACGSNGAPVPSTARSTAPDRDLLGRPREVIAARRAALGREDARALERRAAPARGSAAGSPGGPRSPGWGSGRDRGAGRGPAPP